MNILVISNITLEPYFCDLLKKRLLILDGDFNCDYILYEEYDDAMHLAKIRKADYIIISINYSELISSLFLHNNFSENEMDIFIQKTCNNVYKYIKAKTQNPIFWIGFEDYELKVSYVFGELFNPIVENNNLKMYKIIDNNKDVFIDIRKTIAKIGIQKAFDFKNKYRWNSPYSRELIQALCDELYKQIQIIKRVTKKCIVVDCDNVLWGGVVSEDGIEHIILSNEGPGKKYQDFQKYLLLLYRHGVILSVCSKNNFSDVKKMFFEHSGMILKDEHIACYQVNWQSKAANIKRISNLLNIGLDSIVFIDDSLFEIESIKSVLPEVESLLYDEQIYEKLSIFNLDLKTDCDVIYKRQQTYKTEIDRIELKRISSSYDEYLKSLNMKINIIEASNLEFKRISELSQRTNKCTNGKRYTLQELKNMVYQEKYTLYSVYLSDKFSDLGLVGAIGIYNRKLDLFSLSCRALGRKIENAMLDFIKEDIDTVDFYSTSKNQKLKSMIFQLLNDK